MSAPTPSGITADRDAFRAAYTPGPWACTKSKPRKVTAGGVLVCNAAIRNSATAAQNKTGKDLAEAQANARLIAAAPELVEALRECLPYVTQVWVQTGDAKTAVRHERARALLARIEGESA